MPTETSAPSLEQMLDLAIATTSIAMLPFTFGSLIALAWVRAFEDLDPARVCDRS